MKWFIVVLISMVAQGCSNLPALIKNPPSVDLKYNEIIGNISKYRGVPLRWGGTVIEVENEEDLTRIQLLYYPLDSSGRPKLKKTTAGRFILETPKFLDPAVYRKDAEVTVAGTLESEAIRKIGNKTLKLPVISAQTLHLWPERYKNDCRGYNFSPYYYGIYPYGFYGYYRYPFLYSPCY